MMCIRSYKTQQKRLYQILLVLKCNGIAYFVMRENITRFDVSVQFIQVLSTQHLLQLHFYPFKTYIQSIRAGNDFFSRPQIPRGFLSHPPHHSASASSFIHFMTIMTRPHHRQYNCIQPTSSSCLTCDSISEPARYPHLVKWMYRLEACLDDRMVFSISFPCLPSISHTLDPHGRPGTQPRERDKGQAGRRSDYEL